jgi:hypothetical protein
MKPASVLRLAHAIQLVVLCPPQTVSDYVDEGVKATRNFVKFFLSFLFAQKESKKMQSGSIITAFAGHLTCTGISGWV